MNTLVVPEGTLVAEGLLTLLTVVRFLSCMNTLVCLESTLLTECLPTLLTVVRLLSGMNPLVYLKIWLLTEFFSHIAYTGMASRLYEQAGVS